MADPAAIKPFLIVPGLGQPHAGRKIEILQKNIALLKQQFETLKVLVCVYSPDIEIPEQLRHHIDVVHESGIIGEFLLRHANPEHIAARHCTHVFILLDDVELHPPMDCRQMISALKRTDTQIASPSISASEGCGSWDYMKHSSARKPGVALHSNVCEMFFYMMGLDDYRSYYLGLDLANPWCWGVDMTLGRLRNLHALIFNDYRATHWFKGSGRSDALNDAKQYFVKRGTTIDEVISGASHRELDLGLDVALTPDAGKTRSLDLGSGPKPRNPFKQDIVLGLDLSSYGDNVFRCDLGFEPIPFADNSLEVITAYDFLEHLPRHGGKEGRRNPFLFVMSEIHRCLKPGGTFYARTPAYPNPTAFSDPTHVNVITTETARYFGTEILGDGSRLRDDRFSLGQRYGFCGHFEIRQNYYEAAYGHVVWLFKKAAM